MQYRDILGGSAFSGVGADVEHDGNEPCLTGGGTVLSSPAVLAPYSWYNCV